jgi:hypothetical protein
MRTTHLLADLQARGLLPPAQARAIADDERTRPMSLHQELRAALYLGIMLLTGGLGTLLYQHLDDIGHGAVIGAMALLMLASFGYAWRHRQPFTWGQANAPSFVPDYALLLGCLLFLALETYVQAVFSVFGSRYGLATLLPAVLFLALAYRLDHRGVLAMGLTALGAWVGVSVAPLSVFTANALFTSRLGVAGVLLGLALTGAGLHAEFTRRKPHFAFTYISLGANVALLAATAVLFDYYPQPWLPKWVAVLLVLLMSAGLVWYARHTQSYLFLLMGTVYGYIALTYSFIQLLDFSNGEAGGLMVSFYFMLSTAGVILLFVRSKEFLRRV